MSRLVFRGLLELFMVSRAIRTSTLLLVERVEFRGKNVELTLLRTCTIFFRSGEENLLRH